MTANTHIYVKYIQVCIMLSDQLFTFTRLANAFIQSILQKQFIKLVCAVFHLICYSQNTIIIQNTSINISIGVYKNESSNNTQPLKK